jgi:hypothetical protein
MGSPVSGHRAPAKTVVVVVDVEVVEVEVVEGEVVAGVSVVVVVWTGSSFDPPTAMSTTISTARTAPALPSHQR